MSTSNKALSRGDYWFNLLAHSGQAVPGLCASVKAADSQLHNRKVRFWLMAIKLTN